MTIKFTHLILALVMLCGVANAQQGQSAIHGAGDPRAQNPIPNCTFTKLYIDDTTGTIYSATGYPCVWVPVSGLPAGVTSDGANGLNVTGAVAAGASVSAPILTLSGAGCGAGTYAKADGSGCGTGGAGTSAPTIYPTQMINYGDSITAGSFVTNPANVYPARLATLLGLGSNYTNRGNPNDMAEDVNEFQLFPNDVPVIAAVQPLRTLQIGTNNVKKGTGAYEVNFHLAFKAALTYGAIPSASKVMGSAMVAGSTGTCATDTHFTATGNRGIICTASGSTASATITTTGGPIYIWSRAIDADAGTWTYAVDGGSTVSVSTATVTPILTLNGRTTTVILAARITGLSAGSHTVAFVQTHAGSMAIEGIGTPSTVTKTGLPYLVVSDMPNHLDGDSQSVMDAYRADIMTDLQLAQGDGLAVYLAPVSTQVQASTAAADMGDTIHPNDAGQAEILKAFASAVNIAQTSYGTLGLYYMNYRLAGASETMSASDQAIIQTANGAVETLPASPIAGELHNIINFTGTAISVAPNTGQNINSSASAMTIPPFGSLALHYYASTHNWLTAWSYTKPGVTYASYRLAGGAETATALDQVVIQPASVTETLPAGPTPGQLITVKNYSGGNMTIAPNTSQNISGSASSISVPAGASVTFIFYASGSNWIPIWTNNPTFGVFYAAYRLASATETITNADQTVIQQTSATTETMPASPTQGELITVRNYSSGNVTVAPNTSQNINGAAASMTLPPGAAVTFTYFSSGTNWIPIWSFNPFPARGTSTLAAGTVTVSNAAACAAGAQCVYKLANCGVGGTQGMLSVGTVSAGTSFVINSSNAADTSVVCWQIN